MLRSISVIDQSKKHPQVDMHDCKKKRQKDKRVWSLDTVGPESHFTTC